MAPYFVWTLVGLALGYKFVPHNAHTRYYALVRPDGEIAPSLELFKTVVDRLKNEGYIIESVVRDKHSGAELVTHALTTKGFDVVYDKFKQVGVKFPKKQS